MELNFKNKILKSLKNDYNQEIINSDDFYFIKAQDALNVFLVLEVKEETKEFLIGNKKNYNELKQLFEDSEELLEFGKSIFTLISYCDLKANKKNEFNLYPDKRVLAEASVRMNNWVEHLITYKFENQLSEGSIKNAIDYLLNPSDNFTMLSENHRNQISENLFKKKYDKNTFKENFLNFFSELSLNVNNPLNYTHLITRLSYDISSEWKESLEGIMASDSTGWLKDYKMQEDYDVFWNSKRPSGTDKTIKLLKECITENGHFKLFYTSYYNVHYIAEVIDIVENEKEYIKADWNKNYSRSSSYPHFHELADSNKVASVVFLINKFYKVEPISHNQFKIYKSFKFPTQDNLTPIESYITNSENIKKQIMRREIDILQYKKQIILQGPPGTGKTREAKLIAKEMLQLDSTDDLKNNEQFKLIQFHPSYTYEDFVRGIVAESTDKGIIYTTENKILADIAKEAFENADSEYVLIIDEINRANLSSVMGELIYALEYRNESVHSPYGIKDENNNVNTELILPPNLYIIGTMNTADRSVGHIDYAIRRRFAFVDVLPKDLTAEMDAGEFYTDLFSSVKTLFTKDEYQTKSDFISQEFEPKDVALGHSYFIDKTKDGGDIKTRWNYEIKPILLEYVRDGVLKESTLEQIDSIENSHDLKI